MPTCWWTTTPTSKQVTLAVKQTTELEKNKSKRCYFEKQQNSVPKGYAVMPSTKCTYTFMFTFCHLRQNKSDKVVKRLQLKNITLNLRSRPHVEKENYFTWKTIWTSLAFCPGCQDAMQVINLYKLTFWMSVWSSQELSLHFCSG